MDFLLNHSIYCRQKFVSFTYEYFIKNIILIVIGLFVFNTANAKSFLSAEKEKPINNRSPQFGNLKNLADKKENLIQREYHPSIVFQVLKHLNQKEHNQALQLIQSIHHPKKVKKDSIYALYLYLLTYFYFSQNDFEMTLDKSNEYLKYFPDYKEAYQMLYYNLYASYKLKTYFAFENSLKKDFLKKFQPVSLIKPFKKLIIEYSQVQTNSELIKYLSEKKDKKFILKSLLNINNTKLLSKFEIIFSDSEIKEKAFLRKTELISLQQNKVKSQKKLSLIIKESQGYSLKTLKKAEDFKKNIAKKKKKVLKIGFLLPYSIKTTRIKNIVLDIQTSINIFFQDKNTQYEFIFADTALKPNTTIKSFKKLANKDVIAIIGPLSRLNSKALRKTTSNYKIPLFSLTTEEFIGKDYPYFYRYQRNSFRENKILVNYSLDYLNAKKFVAFYDSNESYQKALQFSKEVEKKGGEIVAIEKIGSESINEIRSTFRKITGIYRYLNSYEEVIFQELVEKTTEPDIDAIYLPISPKKIRLISSFFSSYNLKRTYILTNSKFRSPQLNSLALNNLYLADNFSFSKKKPLYAESLKYYKDTQARKELSIYTVATTNLLNYLDYLIFTFNIRSAKDLKFRLDSLDSIDFFGEQIKINANGEISSPYNIYQLKNKNIVPVF